MQQLILGTGTAIWWLTEPHCLKLLKVTLVVNYDRNMFIVHATDECL